MLQSLASRSSLSLILFIAAHSLAYNITSTYSLVIYIYANIQMLRKQQISNLNLGSVAISAHRHAPKAITPVRESERERESHRPTVPVLRNH